MPDSFLFTTHTIADQLSEHRATERGRMKVAVIGATGQTGKEVVRQALQEGHAVTAVVRNPEKVTETHDNLKVVKGDVFDEASLTPVLAQQDAVVSCLGFPRNPQPVTGYSKSMTAIVGAMRKSNISRIVTMTSWFTEPSSAAKLGFVVNWMLIPFLRPVLTNMRQMEQHLETSCQDINYTVVRPAGLKNSVLSGKEMNVEEGFIVDTNSTFNTTSRSDVAAFMLSCLETATYDRKMLAVTTTEKKV
ncbi:Flavin reductase (NADPH) [Chionoecetes opilio]|uniref:Flavin reductase (NADPH) n=1 Tax=Chionoecetes opilio TaxID=41210 RepID=A0A8J5CTA2_CHIOP|nr:Flavin reductase (NADPH) [Chionoecetes opilio]